MTDTRTVARELFEAYQRGDVAYVASRIHDDIDWIIYAPVEVFPFAGARHGRAAVLEALTLLGKTHRLERYTIEQMLVDGDNVAVMTDASFTQLKTGRLLRFRIADFLRFKDGLIVEFKEFHNSFDLVEQELGRTLKID